MKRRDFIKKSAIGAAAAGAAMPLRGQAGERRPNILVVMTDQERFPLHLPPLNRPALSRLQGQGVEFTHAICVTPFCSPSRAAAWTGLYPHQAGVTANIDRYFRPPSMDPAIPTIGHALRDAGYETAYFGKWHLSLHSEDRSLDRYGFIDSRTYGWMEQNGYRDDPRAAADCAGWIRSRKGKRPWMAVASIINPHDINMNPVETPWWKYDRELYERHIDRITLPPSWRDDLSGKPSIHRNSPIDALFGVIWGHRGMEKSEENWKRYVSFYCSLIELADSHLARVLEAVDESNQWDDTIIIYTSDHGDMAGAHNLPIKGPYMYEELLRVPFIVSNPRFAAGRRDQLISNVDLAPTAAGLAGVPWPVKVPGRDLSAMMTDPSAPGREAVFTSTDNLGQHIHCVRTSTHKFAEYRMGKNRPAERELYDLDSDPDELHNLADQPGRENLQAKMLGLLEDWRKQTGLAASDHTN
jgi:arylsulfatase